MLTALKITLFIMWVNVLPPLVSLALGDRYNFRLDGSRLWFDRRPIFGSHKTIRGIVVSIAGGTAVFPLLGTAWWVAATAAFLAMAGDLITSFTKRRFNLESGRNVVVLDQIFEALLPALFLAHILHLSLWHVLLILLFFIPPAYLGSCFWDFLTYRPSRDNYQRTCRSTVRMREWRSCHPPLARWQVMFNLTSFLSQRVLYTWVFKLTGLYEKGKQNALDIEVEEQTFRFKNLPHSFDGFRILLLTDLHLDGHEELTDQLISQISSLDADLCLIGGDIRMETYGPQAPCLRQLKKLLRTVRARHGILGVLGNHDCIEMTPDFEEAGIIMLINDSWPITESGERIWIVGVDDPHYYKVDDPWLAFRNVQSGEFVIFLAHSPEAYKSAADFQSHLYLCGHTHGGQIRLPGRGPLLTNSRAPRFTAEGIWHHRDMQGYTCRGAGASGVPLRFNCPGEISLITLRRDN
ncbi:MAG: CDP-archaeol synthase [Desulfobulbaceae bacterium]|nr:CDP-archaeol synthase [Desulfobulbaceae bacterium]